MIFSSLNLSKRLLLTTVGVTALTLAGVIAIYTWQTARTLEQQAMKTAKEEAFHHAHKIQEQLSSALGISQQVTFMMEGWKQAGIPDRKAALAMLKQVLIGNPQLIGIYSGWEPNAFDGKDAEFVKAEGHDETGRLLAYVNRGSGQVITEALVDYDKPGTAGEYYTRPKNTGRTFVMNPNIYSAGGKEMLMASFIEPIKVDGQFAGISGVDIPLSSFQEMLSQIRPYGTGFVSLIANNGCYVADRVAEHANQDIGSDPIAIDIKAQIQKGEEFSLTQNIPGVGKTYRFFAPIHIGQSDTPWSLALSVPLDRLYAESQRMLVMGITAGVAGLIVCVVCLVPVLRGVSRRLESVATVLDSSSGQVASASIQVSSSSQTLAEGASEQAASLEETSASLEEMASMTRRNAENAQSAKELANQARVAADAGASDMARMDGAMAEIKQASDNIAKIIKTIDEIAFQTNILALNAAVEAARAGEAGMGFAVVADEVRNLAQRSAQAAKETAEKIEDCIRKSEAGVTISSKVGASLQEIQSKAGQVDELVAEIATASREQSQGIDQVNTALTQMDKVTQSNAASAEESASAAEELNAQAQALKEAVGELKALVGGAGATGSVTTSSKTPGAQPRHSAPATPSSHKHPEHAVHGTNGSSKAYKLNGSHGSNGVHATNGSNGRKPHLSTASSGSNGHQRNVIPLEDEFHDF